MAWIELTHKEYRGSLLASCLDHVCNGCIAISAGFIVGGILQRVWIVSIVAVAIAFIFLAIRELILPKIAKIGFERSKKQMIEARQKLKMQHIEFLEIRNDTIIIRCPNCLAPVDIRNTCKCGSTVWKNDFWFEDEINKVCAEHNMKVKV